MSLCTQGALSGVSLGPTLRPGHWRCIRLAFHTTVRTSVVGKVYLWRAAFESQCGAFFWFRSRSGYNVSMHTEKPGYSRPGIRDRYSHRRFCALSASFKSQVLNPRKVRALRLIADFARLKANMALQIQKTAACDLFAKHLTPSQGNIYFLISVQTCSQEEFMTYVKILSAQWSALTTSASRCV